LRIKKYETRLILYECDHVDEQFLIDFNPIFIPIFDVFYGIFNKEAGGYSVCIPSKSRARKIDDELKRCERK
jgi:hypothetical protein